MVSFGQLKGVMLYWERITPFMIIVLSCYFAMYFLLLWI